MGDKGETSVKLMRPKEPRVGDKCGETSVKLMRSKTSRVGDTCGKQVGDKCKIMRPQDTQSETQVWETSGRQV